MNELEINAAAGEVIEFAVGVQDQSGTFQSPSTSASATVTTDEFPPIATPGPRAAVCRVSDAQLVLTWEQGFGAEYYEVREGPRWTGAPLVGRTKEPRLVIDLPAINGTPSPSERPHYIIRARSPNGLYSAFHADAPEVAGEADPYATRSIVTEVQPNPGSEGTIANLTWDASAATLSLATDKNYGSYITPQYSVGWDGKLAILFHATVWGTEPSFTVDDATFSVDSGEAYYRTVDGRDGSVGTPGVNIDEIVDDFPIPLDDVDRSRLCGGYLGEQGHRMHVRVLMKTAASSASLPSAWEPYRPQWRSFGEIQFKVEFIRSEVDLQVTAKDLTFAAIA